MKPVISVHDIWKRYDDDEQNGIALRGTNLDVMPGEILAVLGKSGSGKTTLLNIIAGLDKPTSGFVEINGNNIESIGERGRTELRRNHIGFVFQFFNLLPTLTVFENVLLSLELTGKSNHDAVLDALSSVNLQGKQHRFPHELSGGEQQRVAIARAVVKKPSVILADEPTGNLDTATGIQILEVLATQSRSLGAILIMVSHASNTCRYADRIFNMVDGILIEDATKEKPVF